MECQELIELKDRKLKAGSLCLPDYSAEIDNRIRTVPVSAPEGSQCGLCGKPIEDSNTSAAERCADEKLLYLHKRCQKILLES